MDQIVASKIRHQGNGGTNRVIRDPLMCANILSLSLMQAEQQKEIQGIKGKMVAPLPICCLLMTPYHSLGKITSLWVIFRESLTGIVPSQVKVLI